MWNYQRVTSGIHQKWREDQPDQIQPDHPPFLVFLFREEDYTIQYIGDYNDPLGESLYTKQQ